jgi:hypothetical protein
VCVLTMLVLADMQIMVLLSGLVSLAGRCCVDVCCGAPAVSAAVHDFSTQLSSQYLLAHCLSVPARAVAVAAEATAQVRR